MITYHIGCWLIIPLLDRAVGRGYVEGKVSKSRVTSKLWVAIEEVEHSNVLLKGIVGGVLLCHPLKQLSIGHFTGVASSLSGKLPQVIRKRMSILRQHCLQPSIEFVGVRSRIKFAEGGKIQIAGVTLPKVCRRVGDGEGDFLTVWEAVGAGFIAF